MGEPTRETMSRLRKIMLQLKLSALGARVSAAPRVASAKVLRRLLPDLISWAIGETHETNPGLHVEQGRTEARQGGNSPMRKGQ